MLPVHCSGRIEEEEEEKKASHSRQNMSYSPECAEKMRHNHTVEEVLIIYWSSQLFNLKPASDNLSDYLVLKNKIKAKCGQGYC